MNVMASGIQKRTKIDAIRQRSGHFNLKHSAAAVLELIQENNPLVVALQECDQVFNQELVNQIQSEPKFKDLESFVWKAPKGTATRSPFVGFGRNLVLFIRE